MKELWLETFELIRKHPVLWLPFLCASLAASGLSWFRRIEAKKLAYWLVTRHTTHSVLGGNSSPSLDGATISRAVRVSASLRWGFIYINTCIYTTALVLTATFVGMILCGQGLNLSGAREALRAYPKRILLYSLKSWLLFAILTAFVVFPITYFTTPMWKYSQAVSSAFSIGEALLTSLCTSWIMAPIAIRVLRPVEAYEVSAEDKRLGRFAYMLAAVASIALSRLLDPLFMKLTSNLSISKGVLNFSSVITDCPYALLYIALALLAAEGARDGELKAGLITREFLRALMPLHFRRGDEPKKHRSINHSAAFRSSGRG